MVRKVKAEAVNTLKGGEGLKLQILAEYHNIAEDFSKKESDVLPPTNCAIEIMLGTKLCKPKVYSMTPREMDELRMFIDKNLARQFIQMAT